jgi:predicted DNA-binding transcriptional regulator AlpA
MLLGMVREVDLDRVEAPEGYEVLDATALAARPGIKRETVPAYLSRRNFRSIPKPNRKLAMGPMWYEAAVREWEERRSEGG